MLGNGCVAQTSRLTALVVATLAGCAILNPPDRTELTKQALAQAQLPTNWKFARTAGEFDAESLGFDLPPELIALIREAQTNNPDLRIAAARMEQSRSAVTAAGAALLPMIGVGGQTGSSTIAGSANAVDGLALVANWEIDLWGKTRLAQAAATEQSLAAELDTLYLRQSIAAAVVKAWLTVVEINRQIRLQQEIVELSERQVALIQVGQKVGRDTQQDVVSNQLAVKANRSQLLQSQQALNSAIRAVEILVGRYPAAEIAVANTFPAEPRPLPAGLPSELAERRPDLKAAESRFRAAFYDAEAAKKIKLPSLKLVGGISYVKNDVGINNPITSLAAQVVGPIFSAGAIDAQIDIKTAQQQEATAQYAKAMFNALSEIEAALYADQILSERYVLEKAQFADQEKIVEFQRIQMKVGKGSMYQLQQQQLNLSGRKLALLRIQNERLIQRVNLHLALGGIYKA